MFSSCLLSVEKLSFCSDEYSHWLSYAQPRKRWRCLWCLAAVFLTYQRTWESVRPKANALTKLLWTCVCFCLCKYLCVYVHVCFCLFMCDVSMIWIWIYPCRLSYKDGDGPAVSCASLKQKIQLKTSHVHITGYLGISLFMCNVHSGT